MSEHEQEFDERAPDLRNDKAAARQRDISHRGDSAGSGGPAGASGAREKGAIDGIGGTGGSSGAGATRAPTRQPGDISGIDVPSRPPDASSGTVTDYKRPLADGGNRGKTRGPDSETIPNADDDDQQDEQ